MSSPILLIDDERAILSSLTVLLAQNDYYDVDVLSESRLAPDRLDQGAYDLLVLDMSMPEVSGMDILRYTREHHPHLEVIILTGLGDVELAVEAMKLGAYDYLTKPASEERLIFTIRRALERVEMRRELDALRSGLERSSLQSPGAFSHILTRSPKMLSTLMKVEQIAPTSGTVLIWGESGTGKELVASAIHNLSKRADKPFVAVNAGVFAAEKGAFTGATEKRKGFLEEAAGGTLFLDEIGELPFDVQVKLLRVLQEGEFFRVGSTVPRKADVRILAATNKDLHSEIRKGTFRKDLFYRLNINSITLPPLREREGDVAYLAHHFLRRCSQENDKEVQSFTDPALELLVRYDFPGNVRELMNVVHSAVVFERSDQVQVESLPSYLLKATRRERPVVEPASSLDSGVLRTLQEVEREHLAKVLRAVGNNRTRAARVLGLSRAGLHNKIKRFGL